MAGRTVSRAEAWTKVYEAFQTINFASYDFNSVKQALIDYTKLYYRENFNDYIESSEFIAILEMFAYIAEITAYRIDMLAHENFLTAAQRKESILRLAKLISYSPSRNIPSRGLVKITSVRTTENIADTFGNNLANKTIIWNDSNNANWKEQFLTIIQQVLAQEFGSVNPNERLQMDDVLFELYPLKNNPIVNNGPSVFTYNTTVSGKSIPMELVPITFSEGNIIEKRPEVNMPFTIIYGNDALGDSSGTTGFFCFTKQGNIRNIYRVFDGITPNQTFDLNDININETDIWVNNIDSITLAITNDGKDTSSRSGEWVQVDLAHAQNIVFNTNKNRKKYEIETLANDNVRLIFGDGEFADIPSGAYHIWYRVSGNSDAVIPQSAIIDKQTSFTYKDSSGIIQTFSFTFSLINTLQNGSPSEDIEHIRRVAPSVYYTQDRMVNGRDYNTFMLQDPSILKLRAINRTFSGDSKYISWYDPSEYYDNVKIFGDDLVLYYDSRNAVAGRLIAISTPISVNQLITNYIQPLIGSMEFFMVMSPWFELNGNNINNMRKEFNQEPLSYDTNKTELAEIGEALNMISTSTVDLYYTLLFDEWWANPTPAILATDPNAIKMLSITAQYQGSILSGWTITHASNRLIAHSESTKFWNTNRADRLVPYDFNFLSNVVTSDSLNTNADNLIILKANSNGANSSLLSKSYYFNVMGIETIDTNLLDAGLPDVREISVVGIDFNNDNIPDFVNIPELFYHNYNITFTTTPSSTILNTLPKSILHVSNVDEMNASLKILLYTHDNHSYWINYSDTPTVGTWSCASVNIINSVIQIQYPTGVIPHVNDVFTVSIANFVYFSRLSAIERWIPIDNANDTIRMAWYNDLATVEDQRSYIRFVGRGELNFAWMHRSPRYHLVDPAATNIIDIFIITNGYYTSMKRYLNYQIAQAPTPPTPLDLRTSYSYLIDNKMISDTVVLHSGKIKLLFGTRAEQNVQASFKVIRPKIQSMSDNQVRSLIVETIKVFFDINKWEFGETFYFSELSAYIHAALGAEIDSIVLVPTYTNSQFGDLYQIRCNEDEIFIPDITINQIEFVSSYTQENLRQ